jgi:hypothetical protein
LPATSLVLSAGAIGSFVGAHRTSVMVIAILFAAALTSVASFAGEGLAPADPDGSFRGYAGGRFAYANPENDAVTRTYSYHGERVNAPQRDHTVHRTIGRPALNATPMSARSVPNVIVVNGRRVEVVSPDEVNSIDLAAEAPGLERADRRFARPAATVSASPTLLAQALSVIAGALAALAVGLFLIGRTAVRIPRVVLE